MRTLVKIPYLLLATALVGCPDESAFEAPPTGAPCEDFGGRYTLGDAANVGEYVFCDRGHVTRVLEHQQVLREDDLCEGQEVRGDGLCIDLCYTRTPPQLNGVTRICLVEDTPPYSTAAMIWDQAPEGCDALFAYSPENGQACVGSGWGCAGVVPEPGLPPSFGTKAAIWCEQGTLRVVARPGIALGETIFWD